MISFRKIIESLLHFVADPHCALCNEPLEMGEMVVCRQCIEREGLFDTFQLQVPNNPMERRLHGSCITAASSLMVYEKDGISQRLVHDLKYHGRKNIAEMLGVEMAKRIALNPRYTGVDCVVPVPLHVNKLKERGYNQSELIAERIAKELNIQFAPEQLVRITDNKAQVESDIEERQKKEIKFMVRDESWFEGKKVLLIDDVFTTGTTVLSCAKAFSNIKGINIVLYTTASPLGR